MDTSKPLDATRSLEVSKAIKTKTKTSFDKAYQAALLTDGSMYVQGFVVIAAKPHQPIEHSWLELDDCLVDPSLPQLKQTDGLYYFPAQRLSVEQLKAAVEEAVEDYPEDNPLPVYGAMPYEYYGDSMLGGRDYQAAYEAAVALCRELHQKNIQSAN